jgi:hypothetical protein
MQRYLFFQRRYAYRSNMVLWIRQHMHVRARSVHAWDPGPFGLFVGDACACRSEETVEQVLPLEGWQQNKNLKKRKRESPAGAAEKQTSNPGGQALVRELGDKKRDGFPASHPCRALTFLHTGENLSTHASHWNTPECGAYTQPNPGPY